MSNHLVSIDPGVNAIGIAVFTDGKLVGAEYIKKGDSTPRKWAVEVESWIYRHTHGERASGMIEIPQVYDRRHSKGDPNDLINLAVVCGAMSTIFPSVGFIKPREWKGQIPKAKPGQEYIVEMRARKRLSAEELARVALPRAKSLAHNLWDGIGIGLWALERVHD